MLKVCHVVASLNRYVGGPAVSVPALTDALALHQVTCSIWTNDYPELGTTSKTNTTVHSLPITKAGKLLRGLNPALKQALLQSNEQFNVVHSHGLWMSPNRYARILATQRNIPLVLSPRGMVQAWSREYHPVRKKIAWWGFERENLNSASGFHATSLQEAHAIRELGFQQPIAVIPNGITPIKKITAEQRNERIRDLQLNTHQRYCLFLSRIHPKKGLRELLISWQTLQAKYPEWILLIAGPDLTNHLDELKEYTNPTHAASSVRYLGPADVIEREVLFEMSDAFILPSYSENFGLVVGEAMLRGLPVVTTQNTPWQFIESVRAGWLCEPNSESIYTVLDKVLACSQSELKKRGAVGKKLITEKYDWDAIAKQMKRFYQFLLAESDTPDFLFDKS